MRAMDESSNEAALCRRFFLRVFSFIVCFCFWFRIKRTAQILHIIAENRMFSSLFAATATHRWDTHCRQNSEVCGGAFSSSETSLRTVHEISLATISAVITDAKTNGV